MTTRYHTFDDSDPIWKLYIYLDIRGDSADQDGHGGTILPGGGPNSTYLFLSGIQSTWANIANKSFLNVRITIVLSPGTELPKTGSNLTANPPLTINGTSKPLSYVKSQDSDPPGASYFKFVTGRGAHATPSSKSGRISYVNPDSGEGYLYELGLELPGGDPNGRLLHPGAAAHELGHVLGLADRYFDAVYWLINQRIGRKCKEVKGNDWFDPANNFADFRDSPTSPVKGFYMPDLNVVYAIRVSLPMVIQQDTEYDPINNLMSTGTDTLAATQVDIIKAVGDLGMSASGVDQFRESPPPKWVAILGQYRRNLPDESPPNVPLPNEPGHTPAAQRLEHNAWEARLLKPDGDPGTGGTGLVWKESPGNPDGERYPCFGPLKRGRNADGRIVDAEVLARSLGRRRTFDLRTLEFTKNASPIRLPWMCYVRQLIHDLRR